MKKKKVLYKYFNNNEEYFNFLKKENVKIINVEFTHNFKIKVSYVIIK